MTTENVGRCSGGTANGKGDLLSKDKEVWGRVVYGSE